MKTVTLGALVKSLATSAAVTLAVASVGLGCSRNNIEAVNLAIEGDKAKAADLDGAIAKYEQATNLDPTNHRILWKLALAYTKKEAWDKVVTTSVKAQKLAPKNALYFFQQGLALARQAVKGPTGWADAKAPLEEAIKLDPNVGDGDHYGAAHFELAEVLLHLDDEKGAIEEYTRAIQSKPDTLAYYGPLAELYLALNFINEAEQVLNTGLSFAKEGDKSLFNIHSFLGDIYDRKKEPTKALASYESAKKACGPCNEAGQQIAFFNLGAAYAGVTPPRKAEAMAQLQSFQKMICKGAAAQRYADQCTAAQTIASKLGGTLQ